MVHDYSIFLGLKISTGNLFKKKKKKLQIEAKVKLANWQQASLQYRHLCISEILNKQKSRSGLEN